MDVTALYPNIKKDMAEKAVIEAVEISKLKWKNIDVIYLTRYESLVVERKKIVDENFDEHVRTPKNTTTLNSFTIILTPTKHPSFPIDPNLRTI